MSQRACLRSRLTILLLLPVFLVPGPVCSAQDLSAATRTAILAEARRLIDEHYVIAEGAARLVASLDRVTETSRSPAQSPDRFTAAVNETLQEAFPDRHLEVLAPARYHEVRRLLGADTSGEARNNDASEAGPIGHGPHGSSPGSAAPGTGLLEIAGIRGVSEISRDGLTQVGYIAFERFDGSPRARRVIDRIMRTLSDSERLILDLRHCRGGDAEMVRYLSSYLFAEPTHLVSTARGRSDHGTLETTERWTTPTSLSARFATKPVDVLVSGGTFSAAESFAFGLRVTERARLVGQPTGGGGHMNDLFELPAGFGILISVGRTYDPRTGQGWQATGLRPDVELAVDHALFGTLQLITEESGKLARLDADQRGVYDVLQAYTAAWYRADARAMGQIIALDFAASHRRPGSEERRDHAEQLTATHDGLGMMERLYHNRQIRNITVGGDEATADLILTATAHRMTLRRESNEWRIVRDDYRNKTHSR